MQGSPVIDTVRSARAAEGLILGQCYYSVKESNKSVSLTVTLTDSSSPGRQSARDVWKQTAPRYDGEEEKDLTSPQRKKKPKLPTKIDGLGEEAYWAASGVGGAMYVLKNDGFFRLSIGGAESAEARLEKSKSLAEKAAGRF